MNVYEDLSCFGHSPLCVRLVFSFVDMHEGEVGVGSFGHAVVAPGQVLAIVGLQSPFAVAEALGSPLGQWVVGGGSLDEQSGVWVHALVPTVAAPG